MPAFKEVLYPGLHSCSLCLDSLGPASSGARPGLHSAIGMTLATLTDPSLQRQTIRWQNNIGTFHRKPLLLSHPVPSTFKSRVMLLLLMICSKVWACLGLPWAAAIAPSSSGHMHAILESQIRHHPPHPPTASHQGETTNSCPTLVILTSPKRQEHILSHYPHPSPPDYYTFCFSFWTQPILLLSLIYKYLQRSR